MRANYLWALPLAVLFWTGCSATSANSSPAQAKVQTAPDPMLVEWTHPEQVPLAKVERRMAPDRLTVNCVAAPDVERTVHVYSLAGGRVMDIRARLGDEVAKGQVLLLINSADLALAISDYKKAQTDEALANKAVDRAAVALLARRPGREGPGASAGHRAESAGRRGLGAGADPAAGRRSGAAIGGHRGEVADRGDHCGAEHGGRRGRKEPGQLAQPVQPWPTFPASGCCATCTRTIWPKCAWETPARCG